MVQKALIVKVFGKIWFNGGVTPPETVLPPEERADVDSAGSVLTSPRHTTLTRRELEVLLLIAAGLCNVEIADRLELTPATIISYLNSIYKKLGVRSRTAAMRYALDHHICSTACETGVFAEARADLDPAYSVLALTSPQHAALTRRELEVLVLVSAGLSNAQIAERLVITPATVISYLNGIYKKLGVRSRTAAMRYALDHHLC